MGGARDKQSAVCVSTESAGKDRGRAPWALCAWMLLWPPQTTLVDVLRDNPTASFLHWARTDGKPPPHRCLAPRCDVVGIFVTPSDNQECRYIERADGSGWVSCFFATFPRGQQKRVTFVGKYELKPDVVRCRAGSRSAPCLCLLLFPASLARERG